MYKVTFEASPTTMNRIYHQTANTSNITPKFIDLQDISDESWFTRKPYKITIITQSLKNSELINTLSELLKSSDIFSDQYEHKNFYLNWNIVSIEEMRDDI